MAAALFEGLRQCPVARLAALALFMQVLLQVDAPWPVLCVRLDKFAALIAVAVEDRLALTGLTQARVLRGLELAILQRFEVAVLGHARGFVTIDDLALVAVERPLS